jgi:hypothetical protein
MTLERQRALWMQHQAASSQARQCERDMEIIKLRLDGLDARLEALRHQMSLPQPMGCGLGAHISPEFMADVQLNCERCRTEAGPCLLEDAHSLVATFEADKRSRS